MKALLMATMALGGLNLSIDYPAEEYTAVKTDEVSFSYESENNFIIQNRVDYGVWTDFEEGVISDGEYIQYSILEEKVEDRIVSVYDSCTVDGKVMKDGEYSLAVFYHIYHQREYTWKIYWNESDCNGSERVFEFPWQGQTTYRKIDGRPVYEESFTFKTSDKKWRDKVETHKYYERIKTSQAYQIDNSEASDYIYDLDVNSEDQIELSVSNHSKTLGFTGDRIIKTEFDNDKGMYYYRITHLNGQVSTITGNYVIDEEAPDVIDETNNNNNNNINDNANTTDNDKLDNNTTDDTSKIYTIIDGNNLSSTTIFIALGIIGALFIFMSLILSFKVGSRK